MNLMLNIQDILLNLVLVFNFYNHYTDYYLYNVNNVLLFLKLKNIFHKNRFFLYNIMNNILKNYNQNLYKLKFCIQDINHKLFINNIFNYMVYYILYNKLINIMDILYILNIYYFFFTSIFINNQFISAFYITTIN